MFQSLMTLSNCNALSAFVFKGYKQYLNSQGSRKMLHCNNSTLHQG